MQRSIVAVSILALTSGTLMLSGKASAEELALSVTLNSAAFDTPPAAGSKVLFEAIATGGAPPYIYEWDLDGDGEVDRRSQSAQIEASFPQDGAVLVSVQVSDAEALLAGTSQSIIVRGPQLRVAVEGPPIQFSGNGNGDGLLDPNETWQQLFRFVNVSGGALPAGYALFARSAESDTAPEVRLPKGLQPLSLPALAVDEAVTIRLLFGAAFDTACGSRVALDFVGNVTATGSVFMQQPVIDLTVPADCHPNPQVGITPPPGMPPQGFRPGLYFNAERPGNGLATFVYGTSTFVRTIFAGAWYTALPDRTPVWYTLQGDLRGTIGVLPIRHFRNADAPDGFAPVSEQVGEAWVWQIDRRNVLMVWQFDDGRFGAELMAPLAQPLGHPNHTQTWFNPDEPGWGLAIETPANVSASAVNGRPFEFFGAFVYDAAGAPRWASGSINSTNGGVVDLIGHRPHCPACPWISDWSNENSSAGSMQISYDTDSNQSLGTVSTAITLPEAYAGEWNRSATRIQPIATPMVTPIP